MKCESRAPATIHTTPNNGRIYEQTEEYKNQSNNIHTQIFMKRNMKPLQCLTQANEAEKSIWNILWHRIGDVQCERIL